MAKQSTPGPRKDHPPRQVQPKHHDTYAARKKPAGSLVCDECAVVYHGGKWFWGVPPLSDVAGGLCPACARVRDRYPAGSIRLRGKLLSYREEIEGLVANVEKAQREEHPLERVMGVAEDEDGALLITTTGLHIARWITSKLENRFHAKAEVRYPEEQHLVYVDLET